MDNQHYPAVVTSPPAHEPMLISANAAAELLNISARTLWGLTDAGEIPHVRIGRRVMYRPESLRAWLAAREKGVK